LRTPKQIGPLEMRVLGLLGPQEALTVAEVRDRLRGAGDDLAYTTVMTVLVRLRRKGLVSRIKDGPRRYKYVASAASRGAADRLFARVRRALFQSDRARPILTLLADEELSRDELRELRRAIDARLKAGKP
jgi:predicted transcriptional regulator